MWIQGRIYPNIWNRACENSDFVLLVCTPAFAKKANEGLGGVGYEKRVVTGEIFASVAKPGKFVPLLRSGEAAQSLPSYLLSRVFVDFRENARYTEGLEILLRHLHKQPKYPRPPTGPISVLPSGQTAANDSSLRKPTGPAFEEVYKFAYSPEGMNKNRFDAETFTQEWLKKSSSDFELFRKVYLFAYSSNGMDKNHFDAEEFARKFIKGKLAPQFELFREVYTFAYSSEGMDKTRFDAEDFTRNWFLKHLNEDLGEFKRAYEFAYSSEGLNKSRLDAETWAWRSITKPMGDEE